MSVVIYNTKLTVFTVVRYHLNEKNNNIMLIIYLLENKTTY